MGEDRLGKYELRGVLGRGAMGVVHRAYDTVLEREVALKTMADLYGKDEDDTLRFLREARTAGGLRHPNIVTIHELGTEGDVHYIAMELMEGQDLERLIKSGNPGSLARRLEIVACVCEGLHFAHEAGIVHRDVKPANVFLTSEGGVKILDFGVAKIASSDATRTGLVIGTVDYMPPEQIRAEKTLDGRADVFSAGVILYELLFGRKPFDADNLGATLHRVLNEEPPGLLVADALLPPALAQVVHRSLQKIPEGRYASAGEMAGALREVIDSLSEHDAHALLDRIAELDATGALDDREKALEVYHAAFGEDAVPQGTERMLAPVTEQAGVRLWQKVVLAACVPLVLVCLGAFFYLEVGQGDAESGEKPEHAPVTVAALEARNAPEPPLVEEEPEPPAGPVEESELSSLPAKSDAGATPARPLRAPESRPAPRAEGEFVAMIMPWARLTLLEDLETGEPVERGLTTPARMSLPVGRYRMTFDNPHASAPLVVEVTLAAGEERIVRRTMPGFEVGDLTRDLLARQGLTRGDNP